MSCTHMKCAFGFQIVYIRSKILEVTTNCIDEHVCSLQVFGHIEDLKGFQRSIPVQIQSL